MKEEAQMPPKCCSISMPLKVVYPVFADDQAFCIEWNNKREEYSLDAKDRIYCYGEDCGKWIKPEWGLFWKRGEK